MSKAKGFAAGCIFSAMFVFCAIALSFAMLVGGLMQLAGIASGTDAAAGDDKTPEEETNPFSYVWIAGHGTAESCPEVVEIRLAGEIGAGSSDALPFMQTESSDDSAAALRRIRAATVDDAVDGILLEIDSPGGSVSDSDLIYHEFKRFLAAREGRHAVVLMGDECASGGYYVAVAAEKIVARPTTTTGSIGVIMDGYNIAPLAEWLGVKSVAVTTGGNKDILNPLKPVDEAHLEIIRGVLDPVFARFKAIVGEGRGMPPEKVAAIADGRLFSADAALEAGLVDVIGYKDAARSEIAALFGKKADELRFYRMDEDESVLNQLAHAVFAKGLVRISPEALARPARPKLIRP